MWALIIGSVLSLLSVVTGILLKEWVDVRRDVAGLRRHPLQVLYAKQTEFFERLVPVLGGVNNYISSIDAWLSEKGADGRRQAAVVAANNGAITNFLELVDTYSFYLPHDLLDAANHLFFQCLLLSNDPSHAHTEKAFDEAFRLQNAIRGYIGADPLSRELTRAIYSARERLKH